MKVHLTEDEIRKALVEYISNQGFPVLHKTVTVVLTAGRKDGKGHTAQITIEGTNEHNPERGIPRPDSDEEDEDQQAIKFEFQKIKKE